MRYDDGRFLAGPNRFGSGPAAALRVALDPGESGEVVAGRLVAAAVTSLASQQESGSPMVLVVGARSVSLGLPCPNQARARRLLRLLAAELGFGEVAGALLDPDDLDPLPDWSEGPRPARVPVAAITGTNGKSTTTRLLARILREAGFTPGVTTSDGVWVGERQVLEGDYTGPQGAERALAEQGVDIGVLEVARGGILRKGLGVPQVDVGVVTNVAPDHLGLDGVETLEELVHVKGVVVRAVRPGGTCVLNAADAATPRLRRQAPGRVLLFACEPDLVPVQEHLARGDAALLLRDGLMVYARGANEEAILPVAEVPVALGGAARHNIENALAAAAAALALDVPLDAVRDGLRAFRSTPEENPGRLNVFRHQGRTVVIDFAHNAHGLSALLDVADALVRPAGGRVIAVIGTAGDRRDEDITALGEIAARRCANLVVKRTERYLRGRSPDSLLALYLDGVARAGLDPGSVPVAADEVSATREALARSSPGDAIVVMCQEQRRELWDMLDGEPGPHDEDSGESANPREPNPVPSELI
ncbi:MAG: Mur ligase family protein [Chloroflexota bacterium]|nr:Mur ligase family protein [Chloroflexota bacterium]